MPAKQDKVFDQIDKDTGLHDEMYVEDNGDGTTRVMRRLSVEDGVIANILKRNEFERMAAAAGSSAWGGNARLKGRMLLTDFLAMKMEAEYNGKELEKKDIDKYFRENPGMRCAPRMHGNQNSKLLIKTR